MGKAVVIYKTKYGSTEKYAKWISEDTGADIFKVNEISANELDEYDTIVYCGGLYAGGMLGFEFIKKNYNRLKKKDIIVVAVGATLRENAALEEVKSKNLTNEMIGKVQFFLLRGGLNYKKMNLVDRLLMFLLIKLVKLRKQTELNDDTKGMVASYGKVVDFTNKKTIIPIVDAVNNKSNS